MFLNTDDLRDSEIYLKLTRTADADPIKNFVPAYYFDICLLSGDVVGFCDLRIGYNERLYIGGNIGYGVNLEYRGNNYASKACKLLFKLAKKHNLEYLLITCDPENIASRRTCEKAGLKLIEITDVPRDHDMYEEGKRRVCIYKIDL